MMKKQYLSNNFYTDRYEESIMTYHSPDIERVDVLEVSLGHFKIIEKFFDIEGLEDNKEPYYSLAIHIVFKFRINQDDSITLNAMRFSVMGTETDSCRKTDGFKEHDITEKFSDYIKKNYIKKIKSLKKIKELETYRYKEQVYEISEDDLAEMRKGIRYIDKVFEHENELTTINNGYIKFTNGDGTKDGFSIYKGGEILRQLEELKLEMEKKDNSENIIKNQIKRNKI